MTTRISLLLALILGWFPLFTQTGGTSGYSDGPACREFVYYLPFIGNNMAEISALENIQGLVEQPGDFPFDGWIAEIQRDTVSVKLTQGDQIVRNVRIPDHIPVDKIKKGIPVRLGDHMGARLLLAILPQFEADINYAGKGTRIPDPPDITVVGIAQGWRVSWAAVPGANRYRVYRNDTGDETSPDEVGYVNGTSIVVPYESPYIYFGVRSVSGLNESEIASWERDDIPPETPRTFDAENDIMGHRLLIAGTDVSLSDPGFKCWEVQQADDGSGTNTVDLGQFGLTDFPMLISHPQGTTKYYRIRSLDFGDNASTWTAWQVAFAIITGVGQSIQDKFDGYASWGVDLQSLISTPSFWNFLIISNLDTLTGWSTSGPTPVVVTTPTEEGSAIKFSPVIGPPAKIYKNTWNGGLPMNFNDNGTWDTDDYLLLSFYVNTPASISGISIEFAKEAGRDNRFEWSIDSFVAGWNYASIKIADLDQIGTPTWDQVDNLHIYVSGTGGYVILDDFRVSRADPDDATTFNDTGTIWDHSINTGTDTGKWIIIPGNRTGEPSKPFSYAQVREAASPAAWYISHRSLTTTDIVSGTIQAGVYLKGDGKAGLDFFIKDTAADSWDMYALEADSAGNTVKLVKWVAGTRTEIASASFAFNPNQILWLGADFRDYDLDGGRIKVYASLSEGNLIQATNLKISAQDTQWLGDAGGSVGVMSYQANARFVNFVAGSPAHADVADVSYALDGTWVAGETKRIRPNLDTTQLEKSDDGTTWTPVYGEWYDWTPTITQSGNVTFNITFCRYSLDGDTVHLRAELAVTSAGTGGNAIVIGGIPAAIAPANASGIFGTFHVVDAGTAPYVGSAQFLSASTCRGVSHNAGAIGQTGPNFALASGDTIYITGTYEKA